MTGGWIKIHRSMLSWGWYDNINIKTVFLHLLLTANYETKQWHDKIINRGRRVCSLEGLAEEVGLSIQEIRTILGKLEKTGEIIMESKRGKNGYTVITLINYSKYQGDEEGDFATNINMPPNQDVSGSLPSGTTVNQQISNNLSTITKEVKEVKNKELAALSPADTLAKKEKYDPLTLSEACLYIANKVRDEHLAGVAQQWAKMRYARTDKSKKTRELNKNKVDLAFRSLTSWGYTSVEKAAACFQRSIDHGWLDVFEMSGGEAKVYFKE